jgi:heat shock protein HslJ
MRSILAAAALVVLALTGCASPVGSGGAGDGEEPIVTDLTGEWRLAKASDAAGSMSIGGVPITLAVHDTEVAGRAPCNSYSGEIRPGVGAAGSDAAWLTTVAWTEAACADPRRNDLERRYLAALVAVTGASAAR